MNTLDCGHAKALENEISSNAGVCVSDSLKHQFVVGERLLVDGAPHEAVPMISPGQVKAR